MVQYLLPVSTNVSKYVTVAKHNHAGGQRRTHYENRPKEDFMGVPET